MKTDVYNWQGKKTGTLELPENAFGLSWNADLVHQVVQAMRANERRPYAHAKGRGEVRGGGKKPWRQKGTGRARHGSIRSPIWKGGGVTHGPTKERSFERLLTKKMKLKSLYITLSKKFADGEMLVLDAASMPESKTRQAALALKSLAHVSGFERLARKGTHVIVAAEDAGTVRAFRNIPGVRTLEARNMNTLDLMETKYVLVGKKNAVALAGRAR